MISQGKQYGIKTHLDSTQFHIHTNNSTVTPPQKDGQLLAVDTVVNY